MLSLVLAVSAQKQVVVESFRWGFDGKVQAQQFNLLTVVIRNQSETVYDGTVTLRAGSGLVGVDVRIPKPCFLLPGQSRRVQFLAYIQGWGDQFTIDIRGSSRKVIEDFQPGRPAVVWLRGEGALATRSVNLPRFSEHEFPTNVTATGGLATVVIDRAPHLTRAQRRAFVDWLRGGGKVFVYHGESGFPQFSDELTVLDDPRDEFRVGMGVVHRVPQTLATIEPTDWYAPNSATPTNFEYSDHNILQELRQLVWPEHDWGLIYGILALFFLLAVPVHGWLSFRRFGYPAAAGSLFAIVGACAWLLYVVGARGYDEHSAIHSLSYAKQIEPGRFDLTQYGNVFVTSGGRYNLKLSTSGVGFSTGRTEMVSAVLRPDASMRISIPVFTSRPFVHRGLLSAKPVLVKIDSWMSAQNDGSPAGLRLEVDDDVVIAWAFHRGQVATMRVSGRTLTTDSVLDADEFLREGDRDRRNFRGYDWQYARGSLREMAERNALGLLAARWQTDKRGVTSATRTGADSVRLVLLCPSPPEFELRGDGLGKAQGYVLYDLLLTRPDK